MTKIKLSKPVQWDGKDLSEISLDLDSLTGNDLVAAEKEFLALNPDFVGVPSLNVEYQLCLAARALKRPVDDIKALPLKDCQRLIGALSDFLLG